MAKLDKAVATRAAQIAGLLALFFCSFLVFLFLTFPYEVLKELLSAQLSDSTGMVIRIGDLSASLPLGIKANDLHIQNQSGSANLNLQSLRANFHLLPLLLGKASASVAAKNSDGTFEVGADFGILDLIGGAAMPRDFGFVAKNFAVDEAVAFALASVANGKDANANAMVGPLLTAINFSGKLNGKADFKLDTKQPTQSTGEATISFKPATLKFGQTLGLDPQVFDRADINAEIKDGHIKIKGESGLRSPELDLAIKKGDVALSANPMASKLDWEILLKLNGGLKEKYGFILGFVSENPANDSELTVRVSGTFDQPLVKKF